MPDPLPGNEDRQFDVIFDLAHLERRRMAMPHQIVDQPLIFADPPSAAAIRNPRRLHDRRIIAHIVDDADKAVIEHRDRLVKDFLQRRHRYPSRRPGFNTLGGDLVLSLGGEPHLFSSAKRAGLRCRGLHPISALSGNRLWRYTACGISVADPGAVPGASTNSAAGDLPGAIRGGETGSTRVVKARSVARHDTTVIGSQPNCERQLRNRGARGLTLSGVKA